MGKKKQQNDFYFFMIAKKPEVEKREGRIVPMSELPTLLCAEWKNMSGQEKQKYTDMRNRHRESAEKMDCRGVSLAEIERQQEEEKQKTENMKREIRNAIDFRKTGGALHHLTIYVIGASFYVRTDEDMYTPAELSIAQFNFNSGIMRELHLIFQPHIPLAYGFVAREHSEATHHLLDEENNEGVVPNDALVDIIQFVQMENDKLPPLYTLDENREATEALLDTIVGGDYFKVYSLQYYFQSMYNAAMSSPQIPQSIAADMLTHCGLDFHPAMACEWHKTHKPDAARFCTLSCVRRWLFNMSDNMLLKETFGIEPQEGKHLPRAVSAYGVIVDVPKPVFKDDRNPATPGGKKGSGGNSSFSPSKSKSSGDSSLKKPGISHGWSNSVSPEPMQPFRKPAQSAWSQGATSIPSSGPSRASSMASIFSNRIDATSEEDFPALGAGVARRIPPGGSSTALAGIGRGVIRGQNPQGAGRQSSKKQPGMGRGVLQSRHPSDKK